MTTIVPIPPVDPKASTPPVPAALPGDPVTPVNTVSSVAPTSSNSSAAPATSAAPDSLAALSAAVKASDAPSASVESDPVVAPTTPDPPPEGSRLARLNAFLDKHVLPYPVKYLTNRVTILGTLTLLIPLILFANITVFVLAANSYLNVMSVVVSSTVLLYSTLSEARDKAVSQRREEIAAQYQKMVEDRAKEDHQRIQEMHDHLDQIQSLLSAQLIEIENENQQRYNERHAEMLDRVAEHSQELTEMRSMLQSLGVSKNDSTPKPE